jgi:hypothetical protein
MTSATALKSQVKPKPKAPTRIAVTQAQQVIDGLPDQAKRDVLFALVGSLNASIVGTASSVASRVERSDLDMHSMEPRDIELLMAEGDDRNDLLTSVRIVVRVAQNLRDQLLVVSNDDTAGSLLGTVDFMTRPNTNPRKLDTELLSACLEAANIGGIDVSHFEAMDAISNAQRSSRLAGQRGMIEWLIEHVFTSHGHTGFDEYNNPIEIDDSERNTIESIAPQQRERVYEKLVAALTRTRDNTILGVLHRDTRYSFSDIPLIAAAINDALSLDAHNTED